MAHPPNSHITIEVWDTTGNRKQLVQLPADAAVNRVIAVLVERMSLPRNSPDGQLMSYKLHHRGSGRQLLDSETLAGAGLREGDIVRLQPEITAGSDIAPPLPGAMKTCRFCGEQILAAARKCRYCGECFDAGDRPHEAQSPRRPVDRMLLPYDRAPLAIIAGYAGLMAVLPLFHLLALVFGILALWDLKRKPHLFGRGRAIFGLVMGILFTLLYGFGFITILMA